MTDIPSLIDRARTAQHSILAQPELIKELADALEALPQMVEALEQFRRVCEVWPNTDGVVTSVDLTPIRKVFALIKPKD